MKRLVRGTPVLLPALLLGLLVLLAQATFAWVDLAPRVDERFFFTPDSPAYRESATLSKRFATQQLLAVTATTGDIDRPEYLRRVAELTKRLERIEGVIGVRSLTRGPENVKDARESPLWSRLVLLEGLQASNVILVVDDRDPRRLIDGITDVMYGLERADFRLTLAGVPYVVDSIGRNLRRDFRTFSLAAVAVSALVVFVLFRSWAILLGSLTACGCAAFGTLLIQHLLGGRIGLLSANLVTISFVLTLSHVVFLTCNWRNLRVQAPGPRGGAGVLRALRQTVIASSWCMVTALLGFGSLLFVEAQPLRELGYGGTIATVSALTAAYFVFPPFLLWVRGAATTPLERARALARIPRPAFAALALALALGAGAGTTMLNTDPSLMQYFDEGSEVRRSLEAVDPHGGSSPLNIAVRRQDRARLDNDESYKRLWALQRAFQRDPAVGTVVSLPVLMAEAERSPLSWFLSWKWLLNLLSKPEYDRVAEAFVTPERTQGLFMMRMIEADREERRTTVIKRLQDVVRQHGFETTLMGGIYALQGRLADLVTRSLVEGIVALLAAVGLIAFVVTRSLAAGFAMLACTATVPTVVLGVFGFARIPLDIVATPGVNVAVGVAVDSMIHMGAAWRRARATLPAAEAWREAQRLQAPGIVAFSIVVMAGFAIFAASSFPPTQRFGLAVVIGTAVAGTMALWVFPGLLGRRRA